MKLPYIYRAKLVRVIDGDSCVLTVDCGFRVTITDHFRLLGINAPEMHGTSSPAGREAKAALESMLAGHDVLTIKTHKNPDKYGRWLVEISTGDEQQTVNDRMVREKFAVPYMV